MPTNQQESDKGRPAGTQQGLPPQPPDAETRARARHAGDHKQSGQAQPRRFSQEEAQSIPADPDPDDPVSS